MCSYSLNFVETMRDDQTLKIKPKAATIVRKNGNFKAAIYERKKLSMAFVRADDVAPSMQRLRQIKKKYKSCQA
jgi:hypothetical protein